MSRWGYFDEGYGDDAPTRAECDREALEDEAYANLSESWDETHAGEVLSRAKECHPHLTGLILALEAAREAYIDDGMDEECDGIADAASLAKDPYAYYGVRRSDFM